MRAANTLIRRYFDELWRYFVNAVGEREAEDLTQETFARLSKSSSNYREDASFRTYLYGIARKVRVDHYRRRGSRLDFDPKTHSVEDLGCSPSHLITTVERLDRLLACMRRLPVETMMLLEMYYWQDLTASALAAELGTSERALRSRLARAREQLQRCARGHGDQAGAEPLDQRADESLESQLRALGEFMASGRLREDDDAP